MNQTPKRRIAVLPGDGIGTEVTEAGVEVLRAVESSLGKTRFELTEFSVGANEYLRSGDPLPPAVFEQLKEFDAILLGAMGLPGVRWPDGVEMTPQLDLRERLDLYCGLRPVYLFHSADSPLRNRAAGNIDLLLIRESTEGLFFSRKERLAAGATYAEDKLRITRSGAERVIRAAFREATTRRRHVTLVDKANVLPSMAFFRRIFDEIAPEFPGVQTERVYVDAAALYLVQRPETFDVMVTENMFGDILSDLTAGLVGGMGMAPSADIGERYAVFQPAHGSAPDIAGKGIANPIATILSVAMMLDWFDLEDTRAGAEMIRCGSPDRIRRSRRSHSRHGFRPRQTSHHTADDRVNPIGSAGSLTSSSSSMKSGFRIFDTHTHLGVARHSSRSCTAEDLLRSMDRHGIDRSLAIPFPVVDDYRAQHDLIGQAVRDHADRLTGAACLFPLIDRDRIPRGGPPLPRTVRIHSPETAAAISRIKRAVGIERFLLRGGYGESHGCGLPHGLRTSTLLARPAHDAGAKVSRAEDCGGPRGRRHLRA